MKEPTAVLYVRVPKSLIEYIQQRAHDEHRSVADLAGELLLHAKLCDHKVVLTREI